MQKYLLLVDDEPNILHALERIFEDDGYHILTAESGSEGLKLLEQFPIPVIISDQQMPNMTGSEFFTQVKALYPDTIRIILSGYSNFESVKSAINDGAISKFYNKPWDEKALRQEIRDSFKIYEQRNEKEQNFIRLINLAKLSGLNPNKLPISDPELERDLKEALNQNQFEIYYQPIVDVKTDKIIGAEALLYWPHPTKGLLSPDQFIPLAEETGLIIPMTAWVFTTACKQLKQWQLQGYPDLSLAINLSVSQMNYSGLVELVANVLQSTNIQAQCLDLEITETLIMSNVDSNLTILKKLSSLGVRLAIDDFGTGYSSLSYLKNFPMNILKIDKSFIHDVDTNQTSSEIVTTIIELAKKLGLIVIAEGVETPLQFEALKEKNCDLAQGFLFSKPVIASEYFKLLG